MSEKTAAPSAEADADAVIDATTPDAPLVEEELLIEDVSIDGMCGVY